MTSLTIAYVGPALSGRSTSVSSVLNRMTGARHNPLTIDPLVPHELAMSGHLVTVRIACQRSNILYQNLSHLKVANPVRIEAGWLARVAGIVAVLDSQEERQPANHEELTKLQRDLAFHGYDLDERPVVFQANKRDLPGIVSMDFIRETYKTARCSYVASVATQGKGTTDAVRALFEMMDGTRTAGGTGTG